MGKNRHTRFIVVLAAALVVASCSSATESAEPSTATTSSDQQADGEPTSSASASPSSTTSPTRPEGWAQVNPAAAWTERAGLRVVELDSKLYLMGGRTPRQSSIPVDSDFWNDVWVSTDAGRSWEQTVANADASHWAPRGYFQAVVLDGQIILLGGQNLKLPVSDFYNDVWGSTDGTSWRQLSAAAPWEERAGLMAAVLGDYVYVVGGSKNDDEALIGPTGPPRIYFNDVWRSSDGVAWELMTEDAPWTPRAGGVLTVMDDQLILLGGEQGFICEPVPDCEPPYYNDVWASADGSEWELLTESAGWAPRPGHACETLRDNLYCFGGFGLEGNPTDMWSSPDATTWTEIDHPPWDATSSLDIRYDFAAVTVDAGPNGTPAILTFGGDRETFDYEDPENYLRVNNDVWSFEVN